MTCARAFGIHATAPSAAAKTCGSLSAFTRVGEDRLHYEYTIDDPKNYTAPFTVLIPMRTAPWKWYEYSCHERNESLYMTLKGARFLESLEE